LTRVTVAAISDFAGKQVVVALPPAWSCRVHAGCWVAATTDREVVDLYTGVFSLAAVKAAVAEAVKQAAGCNPSERKRRIRSLQLRWHPGGITELASYNAMFDRTLCYCLAIGRTHMYRAIVHRFACLAVGSL
jgi:hypothetical protein